MGKLKYFLGIEIAQSNSDVVMSQRKYVLGILEETSMLDCKPIDTPMDPKCQACTWIEGVSTRSREISTISGETELPHHHPTEHFLSCEHS